MTYLALAHGAGGILWFELEYALQRPALWQTLKQIASELKELKPALTGRTVWVRQGLGHPAIHAILKETADAYYLIAVNVPALDASHGDLKGVALPVAPAAAGTAKVLFEDRGLVPTAGTLRDDFRLYERHVYAIPW
jgi:hypothetical protein